MQFSPLDSWGEVVSVFLCLLYGPSYDVINGVIMSDADCTPSREPRSLAASSIFYFMQIVGQALKTADPITPS